MRLVALLVPSDTAGQFVVHNKTGWFAGDLSSFIDRQMYLFGEYEQDKIIQFIAAAPLSRRGVILDIGANVGTHALSFAKSFGAVHSFEPNPQLWSHYEHNAALNQANNMTLHKVALGNKDDEATLYLIDKKNFGLGTLSTFEQYDLPLAPAADVTVAAADFYLETHNLPYVDAIKIDVQGYEPEVLMGLRNTLQRSRPLVWVEVAGGTKWKIHTVADLKSFFPYPTVVRRYAVRSRGLFHTTALEMVDQSGARLVDADYIVAPIDMPTT